MPKTLKGYISETYSGGHTKFGWDYIQLLPDGLQELFWFYILWCGNHGNQHGLKTPLPPHSLEHSVVFNSQGVVKTLKKSFAVISITYFLTNYLD